MGRAWLKRVKGKYRGGTLKLLGGQGGSTVAESFEKLDKTPAIPITYGLWYSSTST